MRLATALAVLALAVTGVCGAATPQEIEAEAATFLERARFWQARGRDDLARESLDKLNRIAPDHPEGLALEVRLMVRAGKDTEAARVLNRLRRVQPGHPEIAQLDALLRSRGPDKERLRQARALAKAGRHEEAATAYRAIFPDVFPDDDHALEYAQWLAATSGGWEPARAIFADLARRHPQEARFRLAHANHLSFRKPVPAETYRTLRELSADPNASKAARVAWRRAVMQLDAVEASLPYLREYVAAEPGDTTVKERYEALSRSVEERRRLVADPGYQAKVQGLALLEQGQAEAAAARLREAIRHRPDDAEAQGALGLALLRLERHAEAVGPLERARDLDAAGRAKWDSLARIARHWNLVKQAATAKGAGDLALAEAKLREARNADPGAAYSAAELGRVRAARGDAAEAGKLFREALVLDPGHARAIEGLIEIELRAGRDDEAARLVEALTPEQRKEIGPAVDRLRAARLREQAEALRAAGRDGEAVAALETAARLDPSDPWLRLDLARLHTARGEPAKGKALFDELLVRRPGDPDARFAMAIFLSDAGQETQALAALEGIAAADRSASMTRYQRRLWVTVQGQRASALAQAGDAAGARRVLETTQAAIGPDAELASELAGQWLALAIGEAQALLASGRPAEALQALAPLASLPLSKEQSARLAGARAGALRAAGRWDEADAAYREALAANPGDVDLQLDRAELATERGDAAMARALVDAALLAGPNDPRALAAAARIAIREGRLEEAIALQQRSLAASFERQSPAAPLSRLRLPQSAGDPPAIEPAPSPPPPSPAAYGFRPLAELLDYETPWVAGAIDWRYRSGTEGKSRVNLQEVPLEWRQGGLGGGRWMLRADLARASAGSLDLADREATTFGSVLLCQPGCATGSVDPRDHGVALAAGYERGPWRFDAGTSPLGFEVVNAVGGVAYRGDWGPASYVVDASRRVLPSSLLSYAGTRDPNTGRTWGGVVTTGVRLGLSRDRGGDYGAWGSLGLHRLTGRDVQDNDRMQLMAGGYRRILNEEDRQLAVGVTGMFWRFSDNVGEFTFGHGGYFSPKVYRSIALPITYAARAELWSFALRASVSVSWTETARAPFYPTDAALQAQAEAIAPATGVDPYYSGGNDGRSFGRAFAAAWERQVLPGLFLGARLELERSVNYTPNRFLAYLRLATDRPAARPVGMPPEPVLPSSQF